MRISALTFWLTLILNTTLWFLLLLLMLSPFLLVNSTRNFLPLKAGLNFKAVGTLSHLRMSPLVVVVASSVVPAGVAFLVTLLVLVPVTMLVVVAVVLTIPLASTRIGFLPARSMASKTTPSSSASSVLIHLTWVKRVPILHLHILLSLMALTPTGTLIRLRLIMSPISLTSLW
jgi:hypothetical protein